MLARDHGRACSMCAELYCTKGEQSTLVFHIVDHFSVHNCSASLPMLHVLNERIDACMASMTEKEADGSDNVHSMNREPWLRSSSRQAIIRLLMFVSTLDVKELSVNPELALSSAATHEIPHNMWSTAALALFNDELSAAADAGSVPEHLLQVLSRLAAQACNGIDSVKRVVATVACILRVHRPSGDAKSHARDLWWSELADVRPALRADTEFILWRLALCIANTCQSGSLKAYVHLAFKTYKRGLLRSNTYSRLNLLLYSFACIAKGGVKKTAPPEHPLVQRAVAGADCIFDEILATGCQTYNPNQNQTYNPNQNQTYDAGSAQNYNHPSNQDNNLNNLKSSQATNDSKRAAKAAEKMRVLRCVTYFDPLSRMSLETDIDAHQRVSAATGHDHAVAIGQGHRTAVSKHSRSREGDERVDPGYPDPHPYQYQYPGKVNPFLQKHQGGSMTIRSLHAGVHDHASPSPSPSPAMNIRSAIVVSKGPSS